MTLQACQVELLHTAGVVPPPEAERVASVVAAGLIPAPAAELVGVAAGTWTPAQLQLVDEIQSFGAPPDTPSTLQKEVQIIDAGFDITAPQGK